ncbi:MAG: hypothetical protein ACLS9B_14705 [Coprococcus comes]
MKNFKIKLNQVEIDSEEVYKYVRKMQFENAINFIMDKTGCEQSEAQGVVDDLKDMMLHYRDSSVQARKIKDTCNNQRKQINPHSQPTKLSTSTQTTQQSSNVPHCPTCGSTNIKKISATSKVVGAGLFGLFSKTARSQFECKDCGYKW